MGQRHFLLFFYLTTAVVVGAPLSAQENVKPPKPEFDVQIQLDSFDQVWKTVKDLHWDPELNGVDWEAAKVELRPKVESAENIDQAREAMNELLGRLELSHFGIIPSTSYKAMSEIEQEGGQASTGLTIRLLDGKLIVTAVRPNSGAAKAGIGSGWEVTQIGEKSAEDLISRFKEATSHSPTRLDTMVGLATAGGGKIGDVRKATFVNEKGEEVEIEMTLAEAPGNLAKLGHLPPFRVVYDSKKMDDGIGYIHFNAFLDAPRVMKQYNANMREFGKETDGLIIDMRGNRGGLVGMTMGMSGWFVAEPIHLGEMKMRSATLRLAVNPRRPRYDGPVAILIDECSISAAEILAGGLQDTDVARIFGRCPTAGLVLPSAVVKLPNGDGFQYAMADYASASGDVLEGVGVKPDVLVEATRKDFFDHRDPVLEKAKAWILEQSKSK